MSVSEHEHYRGSRWLGDLLVHLLQVGSEVVDIEGRGDDQLADLEADDEGGQSRKRLFSGPSDSDQQSVPGLEI